jgi:hypothetical protein
VALEGPALAVKTIAPELLLLFGIEWDAFTPLRFPHLMGTATENEMNASPPLKQQLQRPFRKRLG